MYGEKISRTSIKDKKGLLLKEFISEPTANGSLDKVDIDNQSIKLADNTTSIFQGTMMQSPLSPKNKYGIPQDRGEQSKVPSNNAAIKHSKNVKGIRERRNISKATVYRWLTALGYTYSDQEECYYSDAHKRDDVG
eukprot:1282223-Ditylum_brightwellii.AAC.1